MKKHLVFGVIGVLITLVLATQPATAYCLIISPHSFCYGSDSTLTEFTYGPLTVERGSSVSLPFYFQNTQTTGDLWVVVDYVTSSPEVYGGPLLDEQITPSTGGQFDLNIQLPVTAQVGEYTLQISLSVYGATPPAGMLHNEIIPNIKLGVLPQGVDDVIWVPVWECYGENSPPTYQCDCDSAGKNCQKCPVGSFVSDRELRKKILAADDRSWLKYAHIMFYPVSAEHGIPVIADRDSTGTLKAANVARNDCLAVWSKIIYGDPNVGSSYERLPVLDRVNEGCGGIGCDLPGNNFLFGQPDYDRLCSAPRNLNMYDVSIHYAAIDDNPSQNKPQDPARALAHEFGHTLLLGHGNGIDDNTDGKFDFCDPLGYNDPKTLETSMEDYNFGGTGIYNLMTAFLTSDELTSLQVEQARDVALVHRGATEGRTIPELENIKFSPTLVNPGGTTTITGTGLTAGSTLDVFFGDRLIGSGPINGGNVQFDVVIPSIALEGLHTLSTEVRGTQESSVAYIQVYGAPQTPMTTVDISPEPPWYGWNAAAPVTLTFSAIAAPGGDVAGIHYSATGVQNVDPTMVSGTSASLDMNGEGVTTVTYYAEDSQGTLEASQTVDIKIDSIAPTISGSISPAANGDGWHNTDVTVTFTCSDSGSGVISCTDPTTIATEGTDQGLSGVAIDLAGYSTSTSITGINIDKTAPDVTITVPVDGALYIQNERILAEWSVSDALSEIATSSGTVSSGSPIDTATVGTKTFSVTATDRAGNEKTSTVTYTVESAAQATQDIITYLTGQGLPKGTFQSLTSKLNAAIDALNRGNTGAGKNQLTAFINEVKAQRCKVISCNLADTLVGKAQRIIGTLG
jgi:hypothetical protein